MIEDQFVDDEVRQLVYSETDSGRLLGVVVTERKGGLRVVTAYDLDRWQSAIISSDVRRGSNYVEKSGPDAEVQK